MSKCTIFQICLIYLMFLGFISIIIIYFRHFSDELVCTGIQPVSTLLTANSNRKPRGTQRPFLPKYVENTFKPSRVVLDLQEHFLSDAIKFVSVRSSYGTLNLFEITKASVLFARKFKIQSYSCTNVRIFLIPISITYLNTEILGFFCLRKTTLLGSEM